MCMESCVCEYVGASGFSQCGLAGSNALLTLSPVLAMYATTTTPYDMFMQKEPSTPALSPVYVRHHSSTHTISSPISNHIIDKFRNRTTTPPTTDFKLAPNTTPPTSSSTTSLHLTLENQSLPTTDTNNSQPQHSNNTVGLSTEQRLSVEKAGGGGGGGGVSTKRLLLCGEVKQPHPLRQAASAADLHPPGLMQQSPLTLRQKLIDAVDERYNVKDMAAIVEVLGTLERLPVTKEMLESTRLGKTVNEFRKKINDEKLAKRAKALVKKWRDAVLVSAEPQQSGRSLNGSVGEAAAAGPAAARFQQSAALSSLQGYNSSTSSPKLQTSSSKVSPAGSNNSNSLSPRVLTTFNSINSSSSSNNRNGSNNNSSNVNLSSESLHRNATLGAAQHHHGSSIHSPLNSASLNKTSSPTSASYLSNKSKSSPYTNTSYSTPKSPALPNNYSYAPNSENVAKTNAANKRYRKDEDSGIGLTSSGPPSKKAKINGVGGGGTLDDPLLLDEHSKDSIISRTSDHSDGSSKPVSVVSSGAVLSAAPSPLTGNLDSDISPPLSVETGAHHNLISQALSEDKLSPPPPGISGDENSAVAVGELPGATIQQPAVTNNEPVQPNKRGRKRKKPEPMDAAALLREQIAKAQAEGKIRIQERRPMPMNDQQFQNFQRRPSPPVKPTQQQQPPLKQPTTVISAISKEDPLIKNEFVEKYLESQTELRTRMERQALETLANTEIEDEVTTEPSSKNKSVDEEDSKKKKRKDKKKKEGSTDNSNAGPVFPSESEILSRLPPIDPSILEEFKNFVFYESDPEEDVAAASVKESSSHLPLYPDNNKETDNLQNKTSSLSSTNLQQQQPPAALAGFFGVLKNMTPAAVTAPVIEPPKKLFATKIDWGDSDDDEDFEEVTPATTAAATPAVVVVNTFKEEDQVDSESAPFKEEKATTLDELQKSTIPEDKTILEEEPKSLTDVQENEVNIKEETESKAELVEEPLREVEEWEVERLHSEEIENLNGNKDKDGQWREWQETVTMESITGDLLHILPYTIIDF